MQLAMHDLCALGGLCARRKNVRFPHATDATAAKVDRVYHKPHLCGLGGLCVRRKNDRFPHAKGATVAKERNPWRPWRTLRKESAVNTPAGNWWRKHMSLPHAKDATVAMFGWIAASSGPPWRPLREEYIL